MSIGAGAAIGSSMVHGAMDAFSGSDNKQVEGKNTKNKDTAIKLIIGDALKIAINKLSRKKIVRMNCLKAFYFKTKN